MANITLWGTTYNNTEGVELPVEGGGTVVLYEAVDGDNEGYGSTGAYGTWVFGNTVDLGSTFPTAYYLDFTSNGNTYYRIYLESNFFGQVMYYSPDTAYSAMYGWDNNAYKTITITGGTDVANPTFMAWLEANATKQ